MKQLISVVGEVTISKVVKNKKYKLGVYHNTITKVLANGLVGFLGEVFMSSTVNQSPYIPSYVGIGVGSSGSESDFNKASLVNEFTSPSGTVTRYMISSKELNLGDNNISSISLRAFIAPGDLDPGTQIRELGLFADSSGQNMLSRVELSEAIVKGAGSGIDILWNIIIGPGQDEVTIL